MATATLTLADSGKSVEVRPGDTIAISLEENPTTGYRWAIDSLDQHSVTSMGDAHTPAGSGVGGGGTRIFTLQAVKTNTTEVRFKLWREWEGDKSIIQRFDATIHVR
jgi:inhibitor of cysteine peptidase